MTVTIEPIGVIRTPHARAEGTPVQGTFGRDAEGRIEVFDQFVEGLEDLSGFSHVILVYLFHRSRGYNLTVTPYLDPSPRGLFATRAPRRPNPLGLTVVRLLDVRDGVLRVSGVDMLDETPLVDIKPYVDVFDAPGSCRCGWLEPHLKDIREGKTAPPAADRRFHEQE